MSLHEELSAAHRCLGDLVRRVSRLEQELGAGLEIRRVRCDTDHLRESLALLADAVPAPPAQRTEMIGVPEAPYDDRLWAGADDEGLGTRRGQAP